MNFKLVSFLHIYLIAVKFFVVAEYPFLCVVTDTRVVCDWSSGHVSQCS